jgi:hypothetical protein
MTPLHVPYLRRLRDDVESLKADIEHESIDHGPPPHSQSVERVAWDLREDRIARLRGRLKTAEGQYANEARRQGVSDNVHNNPSLVAEEKEERRRQIEFVTASIIDRQAR